MDEWVTPTKDQHVTYDMLGENFIVDLGGGTSAEIYGVHRGEYAFMLSSLWWNVSPFAKWKEKEDECNHSRK